MYRTATTLAALALLAAGCGASGPQDRADLATALGCTHTEPIQIIGGAETHCVLPDGTEVDLVEYPNADTAHRLDDVDDTLGITEHYVTDTLTIAGNKADVDRAAARLR